MPSAAKRSTMARPIPLAPPVTTATLSRSSRIGVGLARPRPFGQTAAARDARIAVAHSAVADSSCGRLQLVLARRARASACSRARRCARRRAALGARAAGARARRRARRREHAARRDVHQGRPDRVDARGPPAARRSSTSWRRFAIRCRRSRFDDVRRTIEARPRAPARRRSSRASSASRSPRRRSRRCTAPCGARPARPSPVKVRRPDILRAGAPRPRDPAVRRPRSPSASCRRSGWSRSPRRWRRSATRSRRRSTSRTRPRNNRRFAANFAGDRRHPFPAPRPGSVLGRRPHDGVRRRRARGATSKRTASTSRASSTRASAPSAA